MQEADLCRGFVGVNDIKKLDDLSAPNVWKDLWALGIFIMPAAASWPNMKLFAGIYLQGL